VALHESFWIAACVAAPVIALAQIVSIGEASRGDADAHRLADYWMNTWEVRKHSQDFIRDLGPADNLRGGAYVVAYLNIFIQVAVLALALASLAARTDVAPPVIAAVAEPFGLVLLLTSSVMITSARRKQQELDRSYRRIYPPD
jgi:hypothetical protein